MYDFSTVRFGSGQHDSRDDGMCVMEAVAFIAGEPHSDAPECACPVISAFCRAWNDGLESDEERAKWLGEFVWRLPGTRATKDIELRRSEMAMDWLVRVCCAEFLSLTPSLSRHAQILRNLPELTSRNFDVHVSVILTARDAARAAASDAARYAEWAAASYAEWAAASDAARYAEWYAARYAASDAASDAEWDAASDAARAAAGDALNPSIERLKQSARDLLDRMVRMTEPKEEVSEAWRRRAKTLIEEFA